MKNLKPIILKSMSLLTFILLTNCTIPMSSSSSLSSSIENSISTSSSGSETSNSSTSIDEDYFPLPIPSNEVGSLFDVVQFVDYAIFNHLDSAVMNTSYSIDNLETELGKIYWTSALMGVDPVPTATIVGNVLTVNLDYREEITHLQTAATVNYYQTSRDIFSTPYVSSRSYDFSAFPYKQRPISVTVETSQQLWYVLDQGYLPVPLTGSVAEDYLMKAEAINREIVGDEMDEYEKYLAIYNWISQNIIYDYEVLNYATDDASAALYDAFYLEGAFDNRRVVCDAYAKLAVVLASIENISIHRVTGVGANSLEQLYVGGTGHAWVNVNLEGIWYVSDPTWNYFMLNTSDGRFGINQHNYFLMTRAQREVSVFTYCYPDMEMNTPFIYDTYVSLEFQSQVFDNVIESTAELELMLRYADSLNQSYVSIAATIGFDVGGAFEEFSTALFNAGLDYTDVYGGWTTNNYTKLYVLFK